MAIVEAEQKYGTPTFDEIEKEIRNNVKSKLGEDVDIVIDKGTGDVTVGGKKFEGILSEFTYMSDKINASNYGDYVNYNVNLGITGRTLKDNTKAKSDWRIFYKNDSGNIFLIATDCINKTMLPEVGLDLTPAPDQGVDDISTVQWNSTNFKKSGSADILPDVANKFMLSWYFENRNSAIPGAKMTANLLDTNAWKSFANGIGGAEATGGPTLEMLVESWNEKGYNKIYVGNINENGYSLGLDSSNLKTYSADLTNTEGYKDSLYFPFASEYSHWTLAYWLASPTWSEAHGNDSLLRMQRDGYLLSLNCSWLDSGLRPVVCLPYEIYGTKGEDGIWQISQ